MNSSNVTADPPQGRRERNKQRVRDSIYYAAIELFADQGYDQTTVDEIAEKADVARGTFFNHFQKKEDLITEWGAKRRDVLREGLAAATETDPRRALLECMGLLADISLSDPALTRALTTAWVKAGYILQEEPYLSDMLGDFVVEARRRGQVPDSVDPRLAGLLLRDVYFGTVFRWVQRPEGESDLAADLHTACETVLDGIMPLSAHGS
ncbi:MULTISPECIES: TetR/AcrR family transcriptional regulator [Streptomyces]|uniref:TetR/AcrR family transcriptional regulator n=1 Tax=Streptomyces TaxID=1883 RepID=UPI000F7A7E83|nr:MULTISPECIES: TetR/AcrR family transcriptional regulator [Streptomyces]RST05673.1 TetR family transcriptional regulator [Streptomyces sp. WAC07149]GLX22942.1 TetR family transcriptional regulator [Streptomyces lavendulae subsp. lavendulae]GLX30222.1 TetR family transcriptional regulator [Streptomyces lavendulae subsp. lavendulae]